MILKKVRTGFFCMMLMVLCCLVPSKEAQAATSRKLFSVVVNDGFAKQTVPFYEYKEKNGTAYVKPAASMRKLPVYAGAKKVSLSITGKTSYYKNNYRSVTYKRTASLSKSINLIYTLKTKKGQRKTAVLTLQRPNMPKISSMSARIPSGGFVPGKSKMTFKISTRSSVAVKAYYKIKDSKGKVVYQKTLGTKKNVNYTVSWSGKPSKGNQAGLSTTKYVPDGTYKATAYLQYKVGNKSKYISRTVTFKAGGKSSSGSSGTEGEDSSNGGASGSQGEQTVSSGWNWKVVLTGDDTIDYLAETICKKVLNNKMSAVERARALYWWCGENMKYSKTAYSDGECKIDITSAKGKAAVEAYGKTADALIRSGKASINCKDSYFAKASGTVLNTTKKGWLKRGLANFKGDCLIMSLSYQVLCRHAGIPEIDLVENDGSAGHHFWNVMKVNGAYYYTDVNQATEQYKSLGAVRIEFFLAGTNYCYQHGLYKTVKTSRYPLSKSVSKTDCPGRSK